MNTNPLNAQPRSRPQSATLSFHRGTALHASRPRTSPALPCRSVNSVVHPLDQIPINHGKVHFPHSSHSSFTSLWSFPSFPTRPALLPSKKPSKLENLRHKEVKNGPKTVKNGHQNVNYGPKTVKTPAKKVTKCAPLHHSDPAYHQHPIYALRRTTTKGGPRRTFPPPPSPPRLESTESAGLRISRKRRPTRPSYFKPGTRNPEPEQTSPLVADRSRTVPYVANTRFGRKKRKRHKTSRSLGVVESAVF